jgi:ABC-type Na+ efflux pump permease subunit
MRSRTATLALVATASGGVLAAPAAQASDAGLQKTVVRYEKRLTPLAKSFAKADKALATATDTNAASAAAGAFRTGLRSYKTALVPITTQSSRGAAGKKQMLTAIREFDLGLVQYQKLLDKLNAGADKDSLKSTFVTLNKRIAAAADDEAAALKLLKIS